MGIAPIPNLIPMHAAAPSAAPVDLPSARAIDFRGRQEQEQDDATYTPGGREDENHPDEQRASETLEATPETLPDPIFDTESDDQPPPGTISLFA
jgi:hypothetical protein